MRPNRREILFGRQTICLGGSAAKLLLWTTAHHGVQPHSTSPFCFGGHFTLPYEQNTQQSRGFGFSSTPQPLHS
jgi:nitrate/TMAO reductase-like tetraheme cytochrome c subunit